MATTVETADESKFSGAAASVPSRTDTDVVGARIGAELVDNVIMFVLYFAVYIVVGGSSAVLGGAAGGDGGAAAATGGMMMGVFLASLSLFAYNFALEGWWNGQTVGKKLLSVKVVQENGADVTPVKAAIRALPLVSMSFLGLFSVIGGLIAMPVFAFYLVVGIIAIAISDKRQRVCDRIAGTIVVQDSE